MGMGESGKNRNMKLKMHGYDTDQASGSLVRVDPERIDTRE